MADLKQANEGVRHLRPVRLFLRPIPNLFNAQLNAYFYFTKQFKHYTPAVVLLLQVFSAIGEVAD